MQSVSIIGVGRVGGALAIALSRAGFGIDYLIHRDAATVQAISSLLPPSAEFVEWSTQLPDLTSDVLLITTSDPDIALVAAGIGDRLRKGSVVIHTSGSLSSESLSVLADAGDFTGSMHPLVSISDAVSGAENFKNAFFCVEGHERAVTAARAIAASLGARPFAIDPEHKFLYHAAAVMACGHLVALVDIATEMLSKCGLEKGTGKEILLPLISSTIVNLQTQSPGNALTGSFARFDVDAIARHLAALDREMSDPVRDVYLLLGERSLELAASRNPNSPEVQKVRDLISMAKRKCG
ncbi:MAG TPA: Rossmann-like and DUF2520 domain-containing protein [Pyrinomonadaceae bacterium]|nr:Rossmann-like and DUF2520 domain-containing protein [Pyrinomonadaceae bacterium]